MDGSDDQHVAAPHIAQALLAEEAEKRLDTLYGYHSRGALQPGTSGSGGESGGSGGSGGGGGAGPVDYLSPATRLLEKRRQVFEVQEALEQRKVEYEAKEAGFQRREDALRARDKELQQSLIRFSKFLQENEAKRQRALRKASEDRAAAAAREEEAAALRRAIGEGEGRRTQLRGELDSLMKYVRYLERVADAAREAGGGFGPAGGGTTTSSGARGDGGGGGGEAGEAGELLRRHATLVAIRGDLASQQQRAEADLEAARAEARACAEGLGAEALALANEAGSLQRQLAALRGEAEAARARRDASAAVAAARALEHGQVRMAIANIFRRCAAHSSVAHREGMALEAQLDAVACHVSDLGHILRQHRANTASASAVAGAGAAADSAVVAIGE